MSGKPTGHSSQPRQRARRLKAIQITVQDDADWETFMAKGMDALDLEFCKRHQDSYLSWPWPSRRPWYVWLNG
jgi:hypothetical protein